jgi:6-pyruvoyltetrahydropterin/6-carboxytetrahydropterin synthase
MRVFRLTREVRFAVNAVPDGQLESRPSNSFGGYPTLTGAGQQFALDVTLEGPLQPDTGYLLNIKTIDDAVRAQGIAVIARALRDSRFGGGGRVLLELFDLLARRFDEARLHALTLKLTPTLYLEVRAPEHPMIRLSQRFEFSASHRLHNPAFTDEQNRTAFGKCNNPHGHGHNYELQVTLTGTPDANGLLMPVPEFERIVSSTVIDRLDHKNLNLEIPEFAGINPSVENIAMVIYGMLKTKLRDSDNTRLASVTVWETPKTWCEYSE